MILQRYIAINLAKGWLLVLIVLAAVFGLLSFMEEIERTYSKYDELAAAKYALYLLPNQIISLAPVIALLGSIVALANLDRFSELTIISCTGFRKRQLLGAIIAPTLAFMAVLWAGMEYVTPQLQQVAEQEKVQLRRGDDNWLQAGGVWSTDGRRYLHLAALSKDNQPSGIRLYEFSEQGRLLRALRAASADVNDNRQWVFKKVREKIRVKDIFQLNFYDELTVDNLWAKEEIPTLSLQQESMNLSVLYQYANYLQDTSQPAVQYEQAFWQKLLMPFTVLAMVLLATPLSATVTAGRDRSFGLNIGIGALLGIIFYMGAQIIFSMGQIMQWNVVLVAAAPGIIIMLCAAVMLQRMRW